mmetsp:Transcript_981/g.1498  ORF Transcript_981/g.1498 Transcript_981/m.1498 type:complete len:316 (-) Transcript_981:72-1019(-)
MIQSRRIAQSAFSTIHLASRSSHTGRCRIMQPIRIEVVQVIVIPQQRRHGIGSDAIHPHHPGDGLGFSIHGPAPAAATAHPHAARVVVFPIGGILVAVAAVLLHVPVEQVVQIPPLLPHLGDGVVGGIRIPGRFPRRAVRSGRRRVRGRDGAFAFVVGGAFSFGGGLLPLRFGLGLCGRFGPPRRFRCRFRCRFRHRHHLSNGRYRFERLYRRSTIDTLLRRLRLLSPQRPGFGHLGLHRHDHPHHVPLVSCRGLPPLLHPGRGPTPILLVHPLLLHGIADLFAVRRIAFRRGPLAIFELGHHLRAEFGILPFFL